MSSTQTPPPPKTPLLVGRSVVRTENRCGIIAPSLRGLDFAKQKTGGVSFVRSTLPPSSATPNPPPSKREGILSPPCGDVVLRSKTTGPSRGARGALPVADTATRASGSGRYFPRSAVDEGKYRAPQQDRRPLRILSGCGARIAEGDVVLRGKTTGPSGGRPLRDRREAMSFCRWQNDRERQASPLLGIMQKWGAVFFCPLLERKQSLRQKVVAFSIWVCYNTFSITMQGSYIGNTTASQAVKAGSTPVSCSIA